MVLKSFLDKLPRPTRRIVLELDLARGVLETFPRNPLQMLQVVGATAVSDLREHLTEAVKDERVAGLIVHAVDCGQPMTVMDEIAHLIEAFGTRRPTMAWAESFGELSNSLAAYKLATACRTIWLQPTGALGIGGVEVDITLFRGLLEKVGVTPQFGQRHEYKTAADQFAAPEITEANREMTHRLAQSAVDDAVAVIARRRDIALETVWEAVNSSPVVPERAKELGLIDEIGYRDEAYAKVLAEWAAKPGDLLYASRYQPRPNLAGAFRRDRPKVAVVSLRGPIETGRGRPGTFTGPSVGADVVDEHLRAVLRDDQIKAVLFEVDSPGGSAVASDFIRRSVLRLRESGRPVVARMGAMAASGGYYVSMPCDEIVAHATTLTGSIGVLAGKFVTRGLYEKLGLKREPIRIGAASGTLSSATEFSPEDWDRLNAELDRIYRQFTTLAAQDRAMDHEHLESLARGRVWSGADACERGLVDHVGDWRLAWRRVCALADIDPEEATPVRIGAGSVLERIIPARSSEHRAESARISLPTADDLLTRAAELVGLPIHGVLSLPFHIKVR